MAPAKHEIVDPEIFKSFIGLEVFRSRYLKSMTQIQLAKRCGLSASVISRIERGKRNVSLYDFYLICVALEANPEDILPPVFRLG